MRLSWNEIRARAAAFAEEWRDAAYEKGETQSFYNAFFRVFGVQRRSVARYEAHVAKLDNHSGFIDLFLAGRAARRTEERRARISPRHTIKPRSISTRCPSATVRATSW